MEVVQHLNLDPNLDPEPELPRPTAQVSASPMQETLGFDKALVLLLFQLMLIKTNN